MKKTVYFYWGGIILPYARYLSIFSFKRQNPSWDVILFIPKKITENISWKSLEQKYNQQRGKNYLEEIKKLDICIQEIDMSDFGYSNDISEVLKSDIIRLNILSSKGGLWSDIDIYYFKSIEETDLYFNSDYVCYEINYRYYLIGFLYGEEDSKLYAELFNKSKDNFVPTLYQSVGSSLFYQVLGDNWAVKAKNIPREVVYPSTDIKELSSMPVAQFKTEKICSITIGVHWYAGHPVWEYLFHMNRDELLIKEPANIVEYLAQVIEGKRTL
jgi:hypothetical protein